MTTVRINAAIEAFTKLIDLERDYVLDELRLVPKSMQLRALQGMSNYESQAMELSELVAAEHKKVQALTERVRIADHELLEAQRKIEVLTAKSGGGDSDSDGAQSQVTFDANGGAPQEQVSTEVAEAAPVQARNDAQAPAEPVRTQSEVESTVASAVEPEVVAASADDLLDLPDEVPADVHEVPAPPVIEQVFELDSAATAAIAEEFGDDGPDDDEDFAEAGSEPDLDDADVEIPDADMDSEYE